MVKIKLEHNINKQKLFYRHGRVDRKCYKGFRKKIPFKR